MSTVGLVEAQRELTHSQKSRDPRPSTTVRSDAPCFFGVCKLFQRQNILKCLLHLVYLTIFHSELKFYIYN